MNGHVLICLKPDNKKLTPFITVHRAHQTLYRVDYQKSVQLLEKMVQIAPNDISNRIRLAEAYGRERQNERAATEFKDCLNILLNQKQYETYTQVAERILYLYPKESACAKSLSEIYLKTGQPRKALARLQVLFKQNPVDTETLELLGKALLEIDQPGKAVSVFRELARIYGEAGQRIQERRAYKHVLEIAPDDARAQHVLSQGEGQTNESSSGHNDDRDESIDNDTSESNLSPEQQVSLYLSDVDLLMKYELVDHARIRCEKAFSIAPSDLNVLTRLKELYLGQNNRDDAAKILGTMISITQKTDPQAARRSLTELLRLRPDDQNARRLLQEIGQPRESTPEIRSGYQDQAGHVARRSVGKVTAPISNMEEVKAAAERLTRQAKRKKTLNLDVDLSDLDDVSEEPTSSEEPTRPTDSVSMKDLSASLSGDLGFDVDFDALAPPPDDDEFGDLLVDDPDESVGSVNPTTASVVFDAQRPIVTPATSVTRPSQQSSARDSEVLVPPPIPAAALKPTQRLDPVTKEAPVDPLQAKALIPPAPPVQEDENDTETIDVQTFQVPGRAHSEPKDEVVESQDAELDYFSINMDMDFSEGTEGTEMTLESMSVDLQAALQIDDDDDLVLESDETEAAVRPASASEKDKKD